MKLWSVATYISQAMARAHKQQPVSTDKRTNQILAPQASFWQPDTVTFVQNNNKKPLTTNHQQKPKTKKAASKGFFPECVNQPMCWHLQSHPLCSLLFQYMFSGILMLFSTVLKVASSFEGSQATVQIHDMLRDLWGWMMNVIPSLKRQRQHGPPPAAAASQLSG